MAHGPLISASLVLKISGVYVVYGFTALNLFIFESNEINNATYAFRGDWEAASKLTKTEVLSGHVQEDGFITVISGTKTPEN